MGSLQIVKTKMKYNIMHNVAFHQGPLDMSQELEVRFLYHF